MESMTGYSFVERSNSQFSFSVELKSLNSKFIETILNLPRVIRADENEFQSILKKRFTRGKLELTIDLYDWVNEKPVSLNTGLIRKYYRELKKIQVEFAPREPLKFESVLLIDGITQRDRTIITESSKKDIFDAVDEVIGRTIQMRKKEGGALMRDILHSISRIALQIGEIKKLSKNVAGEKRDQLVNRIESLARKGTLDTVRLYTEIAILADKLDINEEIVRFGDHLRKFRAIAKSGGQMGRRLDFLAQEMFREINTIGSKANSSEVAHSVVEVKNYVDKIREQCRNVV